MRCPERWHTDAPHQCAKGSPHGGQHRCVCGEYKSGAPIVAEQGAPDDGPGTPLPVEPVPPDSAPGTPGPSSLTANEAVEAAAKAMHELAKHRDEWGSAACHGSGCMPRYRTLARAALGAAVDYPQTDDGASPPADPRSKAQALPAPSSLTAAMQVERCRVLLEQWRKDREAYMRQDNRGSYAVYGAIRACENELREALGDETTMPVETPSEGRFRAGLQLTEERTILRVSEAIASLMPGEPDQRTREIYARLSNALRGEAKI